MSLVRAFVAVEIPSPIQIAIDDQTSGLRKSADASLVRWVKPGSVHLTLKFLGDVSTTNLPFVTQMLTAEAGQVEAFDFQVGKLGCFPNTRRPRVIWIGIQAPPVLETLQHGVESGARRLGYESEERGFSPHLTIGRVRQHLPPADLQRIQLALESAHVGQLGKVDVKTVHLIKSDLGPGGSVYTKLFSAPLSTKRPPLRKAAAARHERGEL
jgi:2'-5' RNA ligase